MPTIAGCALFAGGAFATYVVWQIIGTKWSTCVAGGSYAGYIVWKTIGTKRLTCVAGGAYMSYIIWRRIRPNLIALCAMGKTDINIGFRDEFKRKFIFLKEKESKTSEKDFHNVRYLTEESIKMFIIDNGYKPYSFFSSTSNAADTVDCHLIYSARDLDTPYSCNAIESEHILYMMDVNYGYNLQAWLWKGRPIILYSFFPTKVGGNCLEGTFTITDNKITTTYNSGRVYDHQAFDFNMESFVVKGVLFSLLVTVEQFVSPLDPNRRVVCLTPTTWYYSALNWISYHNPNELRRMQYQYGNGNILITHAKAKNNQIVPYVSIGPIGEPEVLRYEYDELLRMCKALLVNKLEYRTVEFTFYQRNLHFFSPLIYEIIQGGWLKSKYNKLECLRVPETGRSEVKPEDLN